MTQNVGELAPKPRLQLRVPKGNGELSGRFVDDPRTSVEDLADKVGKAGNARAAQVARNTAARLADLVPGGPGWFTGIDSAIRDLTALEVDAQGRQLVDEVVERLFWLQIANWTDDFSDLSDFSDREDWDNDFPAAWQANFPA